MDTKLRLVATGGAGGAGVLESLLPDPRGMTTHLYPAICFPQLQSETGCVRSQVAKLSDPPLVESQINSTITVYAN